MKIEYSKEEILKMLKDKLDGKLDISYQELANKVSYSKRQLLRLKVLLETKGIESTLIHGNRDKPSPKAASDQELSFIREFKKQYPIITIAQFKDIIDEDVIYNSNCSDIVITYNLKSRSLSFFQRLFKREGWSSPIKRKVKANKNYHPLRDPAPRRGLLIQIDGTPYDWLKDGDDHCLHLAIDDASKEILAGYFTKNECLYGYCRLLKLILTNQGIPNAFYSDRGAVLKNNKRTEEKTNFVKICDDLGIDIIYALTSQAKGRVERYNETIQNRLVNDIKRFKIKNYEELNDWFNSFYKDYLNKKFAIIPIDSNDEFVPLDKNFDYDSLFTIRTNRKILNGSCFSYDGGIYIVIDKDLNTVPIIKGTQIIVHENIFTNKITIKRSGLFYDVKEISRRYQATTIESHKQLSEYINSHNENVTKQNR